MPKADFLKGERENAQIEDWHACGKGCLTRIFAIAGKLKSEQYSPDFMELMTLDQQQPEPVSPAPPVKEN
jgi:hypothetical protein